MCVIITYIVFLIHYFVQTVCTRTCCVIHLIRRKYKQIFNPNTEYRLSESRRKTERNT